MKNTIARYYAMGRSAAETQERLRALGVVVTLTYVRFIYTLLSHWQRNEVTRP